MEEGLRHPIPPQLHLDGLATRIKVYKYAGYFKPEEADAVLAAARASGVTEVPNILNGFVELFAVAEPAAGCYSSVMPAPRITTPIMNIINDVRIGLMCRPFASRNGSAPSIVALSATRRSVPPLSTGDHNVARYQHGSSPAFTDAACSASPAAIPSNRPFG